MNKRVLWIVLIVCVWGSSICVAIAAENVLRFGVHVSEMGPLDPHFAAGSQDRAVADMLFNGLLRYKPGQAPKIEPDLLIALPRFKITAGRQVWTLKLRPNVFFHPGPQTEAYEMTADDVIFSLRKSANKDFCTYAGEYKGMSFEKVDRYTVQTILDKPISTILFLPKLANYAGGFIVSQRAIEAMGYDQFKKHPVGTGPFMFKTHQPGQRLVLAAHDRYFRGTPLLRGIELSFWPDTQKRWAAFEAGRVDVIAASADLVWLKRMEQAPHTMVDFHGVGEVVTLYLNPTIKPFDDPRVRQAVAYAIDRRAFLNQSHKRLTGSVYSPVPAQFLPGGLTEAEVRKFGLDYGVNLKKAKELLADAGYGGGLSVDLVGSQKRLYRSCYKLVADQLARIGIVCRIQFETHPQMHKRIRREPKPMVLYTAWRPNADAFLSRFFHSDSTIVTGANPDTNFSHYDKIDRLIEAARFEITPEKQTNLWIQAQIRILSDMVAYPLMYTNQCFARRDNVDYGHPLVSTMALYPQFTEKTRLKPTP